VRDAVPVLEARGLAKRYGAVDAVAGVSFELRPGEICGLLGPNGAGKSTTIRMMLGLVRPDAGESRLLGERVEPGAPALQRVGALVEEAAFYPWLSGRQNLRVHQRAGGRPDPAALERALDLARLGGAAGRKVRTYSHGMRQRLGIAQALLGNPEVLILDEPATGLDPSGIRAMRELLRTRAAGGTAVLLSSHLLAEVELLCTSVIVMSDGRVIESAGVEDLLARRDSVLDVDRPEAATALLAAAGIVAERGSNGRVIVRHNGRPRSDVVRLLVEGGVAVESAAPGSTLEDAFLDLTEGGVRGDALP
jgi:ABC-2 type transport system ATP-binding protein